MKGTVSGLKTFIAGLKKIRAAKVKGLERGLKKAGAFLLAESQRIVPVEFGVLRASGFTRMEGKGADAVQLVGYTASYAIYVHEDLTKAHGAEYNRKYAREIAAGTKTSRGPNQQAKFLERPLREKRREIRGIINKEVEKA